MGRQYDGGRALALQEQLAYVFGQLGREHLGGGEDEHGFGMVALLEGIDAFDGIGVGSVASDAPDGVSGVEESLAAAEGLEGCGEEGKGHLCEWLRVATGGVVFLKICFVGKPFLVKICCKDTINSEIFVSLHIIILGNS